MTKYIVLWRHVTGKLDAVIVANQEKAKAQLKEWLGYAENNLFADSEDKTIHKECGHTVSVTVTRYTDNGIEELRYLQAEEEEEPYPLAA